jgi:hypothetical protein
VSLTLVSRKPGKPASRVRVGGEYDRGGRRGFVLLASSPSPALLTRGAARAVARALIHFAERTRATKGRKIMQKTRGRKTSYGAA